MKHVFIFDPKAFYNQQWKMDGILDHIGQFFRTQDKPDFSIQQTRYRRDAIVIVHDEAEKAKPGDVVRIYAVGGEEILFDCLNAVAHFPNMELAVVPHGESSDFLHIFGKDKVELFRDIPTLVKASALPTDIIKWGVNYALNCCFIGLNSATASKLMDVKSSLNKGIFIVFSKLSAFLNYIITAFDKQITSQEYKIMIDDRDYSGCYSLVHVANGPFHAGRMTGASIATPDDGLLDITLIKSTGPLRTMLSMRSYSSGKKPKNSIFLQAKKISIWSEKLMWIQLDNEYIRDTSIDLNVVPHAIQMVAVDNLSYPLASIAAV
jgi:diacylglycerol kinase family enzyme